MKAPTIMIWRKKGEGIIELHHEPPGIPKGTKVEAAVRKITDEILDTSEVISFEDIKMCVPDKVHHFFVMILHISHHMAPFGIGLRHLCDLAAFFASSVTKEMWEEELVPKLKDCGLYNFSKTLLAVAEKYLHMPAHGIDFGADEKSCEDFIADIIDGGNFGRKDDNRVGDKSLSVRLAANNKKSVAGSTFDTLITVTKTWYPAAEKHPVTLPWFMACALTKFIYRRITGKRKIASTPSRVSSAMRRKAMFERINYLEPGN